MNHSRPSLASGHQKSIQEDLMDLFTENARSGIPKESFMAVTEDMKLTKKFWDLFSDISLFVKRVHHSNDLPDQGHHTSRQCRKVRQVPMAAGRFCLTFIPLCLNHKFSPMLEPDIAMTDP